jgi:hypothetical protein
MLAGYLTGALICFAAAAVGQAAMALCGRREPSALSPAVGLAILLIVADLAIRLPGRDTTAAIVLGAVLLAALVVLAYTLPLEALDLAGPVAALTLAAFVVSIPFLANGRMGPLGQGLVNDDMASHLLFTDWVATHLGRVPDLVAGGYPLAPHSLVAAVGQGTGASYIEVFGGLTIALASLGALTAYGALDGIPPLLRAPAAALAALPYLAAAWLAQGAFKEPMLALFVIAFALGLRDAESRRDGVALGLIAAGALYAYSFPGLVWLGAAAAAWAALELLKGAERLSSTSIGHNERRSMAGRARAAVPATGIALGVLILTAIPQIDRMRDFASFGAFDPEGVGPKVGFGNLRRALDPLQGLNIWPASDFRLSADAASYPTPVFYLGALLGAAALAWGLAVAWRRRETALPGALGAVAFMYLAAKVGGTPYTSAKALMIAAPVAMIVALRGLLSIEPAAILPRIAPLRIPLAIVFVAAAAASSFLPLRAGAVGPADHAHQLAGLRGEIGNGPAIYLGRDQFAAPELYPARLGTPVLSHYNVKGLANRYPATDEAVKLDWDGLTPAQLDMYPFVITTRSLFQSQAPANFDQIDATDDYILWKRNGPTPPRQPTDTVSSPGTVVHCPAAGKGAATVFSGTPYSVTGDALGRVSDGSPRTVTLELAPGHWEISLEYVSTQPVHITAPGGLDRTLPASLDFRGPGQAFPTGGEIVAPPPSPGRAASYVPVQISVDPPSWFGRLIGAESLAFPFRLIATPAGPERQVSAKATCDRTVTDFITPPAPGGSRPSE